MATNINTILSWFKTGLKPTQAQFWASWSSFWHKDEVIPQSSISELENVLNAKAEKGQFDAHKTDANAHAELFALKEDKGNKGKAGGYAPLNEFSKIAVQYLDIVDNLTSGGNANLLSAEQGKVLKGQIDAVNVLLASDDVNLDTFREMVDAIKGVQTELHTILVNDLTTGGVTKALTAEQGKVLKGLVDGVKFDDSNLLHKTGDEVKDGTLTATKFITAGGTAEQYVKGDGSLAILTLPSATDINDSKVLHTTGNETKNGNLIVNASNTFESAIEGHSTKSPGIQGYSDTSYGVRGISRSSSGVIGNSKIATGVDGVSESGAGLKGHSDSGIGLMASTISGKIASFFRKADNDSRYIEVVSVENDGTMIAPKFQTRNGTDKQFVKGDGTLGNINSLEAKALTITNTSNVNYPFTLEDTIKRVVFTSVNPVTATIPTDRQVAIPIGSKIEFTQQGTGVVTIADTVTIVTNISKKSVQGETRILTKIGDNTWTLEGNQVVSFEGLQRVYSAVFQYLPTDTDFKKIVNITSSPRMAGGLINVKIGGGLGTGILINLTADIFVDHPHRICVKSFVGGQYTQGVFRISSDNLSQNFSLEFKPITPPVYNSDFFVNITTDTESSVILNPISLISNIETTHEHTTQAYTQVITHS